MPDDRAGVPAPYPLAMLICDAVHIDPGTGKQSILGTFSIIGARRFPVTHPRLSIYIALTDGRGKVPLRLTLVDADEEETLFESKAEVEFSDPRAIAEIAMQIGGLTFPRPGEYRFQLFAQGEHIIERRIVLHQIGEAQE